ncbi:T9SS type A sorting domain-containing protein [candidate division KSB1 bacterium]
MNRLNHFLPVCMLFLLTAILMIAPSEIQCQLVYDPITGINQYVGSPFIPDFTDRSGPYRVSIDINSQNGMPYLSILEYGYAAYGREMNGFSSRRAHFLVNTNGITDTGIGWLVLNTTPHGLSSTEYISWDGNFRVAPDNPNNVLFYGYNLAGTLYGGERMHILRSTDGGNTFVTDGGSAEQNILIVDPDLVGTDDKYVVDIGSSSPYADFRYYPDGKIVGGTYARRSYDDYFVNDFGDTLVAWRFIVMESADHGATWAYHYPPMEPEFDVFYYQVNRFSNFPGTPYIDSNGDIHLMVNLADSSNWVQDGPNAGERTADLWDFKKTTSGWTSTKVTDTQYGGPANFQLAFGVEGSAVDGWIFVMHNDPRDLSTCDAGEYTSRPRAQLLIQYSSDNGATWSGPTQITNDNDIYINLTIAENVDDYIRFGYSQRNGFSIDESQGIADHDAVKYGKFPVSELGFSGFTDKSSFTSTTVIETDDTYQLIFGIQNWHYYSSYSAGNYGIAWDPVNEALAVVWMTNFGYQTANSVHTAFSTDDGVTWNKNALGTVDDSFTAELYLNDGTNTINLTFGKGTFATDGIDPDFGEDELPPPPVSGIFDARFMGTELGNGVQVDFRDRNLAEVEWVFDIQRAAAGDVSMSWSVPATISGTLYLKDMLDGSLGVNVDMTSQTSYTLTNGAINQLKIVFVRGEAPPEFIASYPLGWSMISNCLVLSDNSLATVFPNALSLWEFSSGYDQATTLEPGKGYWLNVSLPVNKLLQGTSTVDEVNMTLPSGWSMIGSIFQSAPVSGIGQSPSNSIISIYGYDGGYVLESSALQPGQGYWVNLSQAATLTISSAIPKTAAAVPWSDNGLAETDQLNLFLESGDFSDMLSFYFLDDADNAELSAYNARFELPPLPHKGAFDVRIADDLRNGYRAAAVASSEQFDKRVQVLLPDTEDRLSLRWDRSNLPEGEFILHDGVDGMVFPPVDMREASEFELPVDRVNGFHLLYKAPAAIVDDYDLKQNYPNPFNPETSIGFSLKEGGHVTLTVFNVLGQKVRTLVNEYRSSGIHTAVWNSTDDAGRRVSGGVFLYRLTVNDVQFTRKMVLIK